ncbi:cupin domain-containing protein [Amycolatopsis sp.]|uniref:cupin domain-containing protein n=1 Tax=Amycolatopsis sp. TaxID=37632 RepID=UPI002E00A7B1|nr:cupin domain-containing protein [Amycolatopsis sp.]
MQYVRPVDFDSAEITGDKDYQGKILYSGETCALIATRVPPGARGPENHVHPSDQLYFVTHGEATIKLGKDEHKAAADSAIFIPAGVPHHNWNEGDETEVHLEVIAPGSAGIRPMLTFAESDDAHDLPYAVVKPSVDQTMSLEGGMTVTPLVGPEQDSKNALIYIGGLPAGAAGPSLHTHKFDQFYLVLEGLLGVQVGLTEFTVGPQHLVVLPAGVPHRQWNAGADAERHLTIIAPPPPELTETDADGEPWDFSVELRAVEHTTRVAP